MKKSLLISALAGLTSLVFAPQAQAISLGYNDLYSIGSIEKGTPDSDAAQVFVLNILLDLSAGNDQVVPTPSGAPPGANSSYTFDRTGNFQPGTTYPNAVVDDAVSGDATAGTIDLDGGFLYLLAKYGNKKVPGTSNPAFYVWYVGGLSGDVSIPTSGLSHLTAYNPSTSVPDGGTTLLLLGTGLSALGLARRKFRKR